MPYYATLEEFKLSRFRDIEARTEEIIARGLLYGGVVVSLQLSAVVRYHALAGLSLSSTPVEAADPLLPPLTLTLLGGAGFQGAVNARINEIHEAESALKSQIRACTTHAQIELVVDGRS